MAVLKQQPLIVIQVMPLTAIVVILHVPEPVKLVLTLPVPVQSEGLAIIQNAQPVIVATEVVPHAS
jgi:hypothetical protein